ncbi:MAG: hypothetical protein R3A79_03250 [Nannocystaceae bacterium]
MRMGRWTVFCSVIVLVACSGDDSGSGTGSATALSASTSATTTTTGATEATGTEATDASGATDSSGSVSESSGATSTTTGDATEGSSTTADTTTTTGDETTGGTSTSGGVVDFCDGEGGILLPGDLDDMCTADLGKKTFLFAVCSCTGLTANNLLKTDSFDSEMMGMMVMDGGSVGVNGMYSAASTVDVGGSLWVDGAIQTNNTQEVAQVLQCGGDWTATSPFHVGIDAFVEGDVNGQNKTITIDGDLHIPQGNALNGASVGGATIKEPVMVKTPCDCDDLIDVAAIVQGFQVNNDNAAEGIVPDQLIGISRETQLELPCGRYYFDGIDANHALTITLTGRTVIAIAGDVKTAGAFTIELGPDAELDLFIAGNAELNNAATIGDTERPAATRIYVGEAFKFASNFTLGANLYQPNATFTANNTAEIWGSIFVGGLNLASPFIVHYDQAILDLEGCEDPNGGCEDCHDCANPTPACKDGGCGPCESTADCCPPLNCIAGECKAIYPG